MIIALKDVVISPSLSQKSTAFRAEVWVNNYRAAIATNAGRGDSTHLQPQDFKGLRMLKEAEEWVVSQELPVTQGPANAGETSTQKQDLASYVDGLLARYQQGLAIALLHRKIGSRMRQSIVFGVPDQSFREHGLETPITRILAVRNGTNALIGIITGKVVPFLGNGEKILNTNLPQEIMEKVGLQYFHRPDKQHQRTARSHKAGGRKQ